MTSPRHILIVRIGTMGCVAEAASVVAGLRARYPALGITLMVRAKFRPLFAQIPEVDFVEPPKGLRDVWPLARRVKMLGVDALADLQNSPLTRLLALLLRLRGVWTFGRLVAPRRAEKALVRRFRKELTPLPLLSDRCAALFERLGLPVEPIIPARDPRKLTPELQKILGKKSPRIALAPFARHAGQLYPLILCDALIGLLTERYGGLLLLGGSAHEDAFVAHMERSHKGVRSLIGRLPLAEELALLSHLDCVVTMDSTTMHLAAMVGTPVVSIWGATHPYVGNYGLGQDPGNAVQLPMKCRPCSTTGITPCKWGHYKCLRDIPPAFIVEKVLSLFHKSLL